MKTRRNTGGFTLLELMIAVAIIGILSGVTAVNVVHYQRTLTQVELDGIAREIFVAAQNHLTMAESQGFMGVSSSNWGEADNTTDTYYYVADRDQRNTMDTPNMLDLMLPFASVDETVLWDGSYVIRYQKNPALVLDVFYAPRTGRFPHTFVESEISPQWIQDYRGADDEEQKKYPQQWRGKYPEGTGSAIIGWYGVDEVAGKWVNIAHPDDPVKEGKALSPPTIKVVNAEQLYVEVTNPNVDYEDQNTFKHAKLNLEITSADGERKCSIPLIGSGETGQPVPDNHYIKSLGDGIHPSSFRVILDDVTQANTRFYKIMGDAGLYPGEDIIIRAVSYNNTELTNIATSASSTTNSLFASVNNDADTADIANFRHLENLDSAVSHITSDNVHITQANQISDMDWSKFMSGNVSVYYGDNTPTSPGCYYPVTNGGKMKADGTIEYDEQITYNGGGYTIRNVTIQADENAGLFAKLGNHSSATNLQLSAFSVTSSNGNAGALAGVIEADSTVTNLKLLDFSVISSNRAAGGLAGVLDNSSIGGADIPGVLAYGVDSAVTGETSVGGLVGEMTGTCTIAQSAAAVYVTSSNGNAGGLIGTVSEGAVATVTDSYAAGHTENGKYNQSNCNVTANSGNAGGLIGSSEVTDTANLTVENCYATTSVDGKNAAGGLIGDVKDGKIKNCYVTGYVNKDSRAGAFAGTSDRTTKFSDDRYLSIINRGLNAVGNDESAPVSAFDDSLTEYLSYTPCTSGALPYDGVLKQYYDNKYLFKTISQLSGGTYTAEWMTTHYGDWPMPETQVVNELAP